MNSKVGSREWIRPGVLGVAGIILALLMGFSTLFVWAGLVGASRSASEGGLLLGPAWDRSLLDEGDVVFRRGRDIMANLVLAHAESAQFSHVGVVLRGESGWVVVHAVPDNVSLEGTVRLEDLDAFLSEERATDFGFYRVVGVDTPRMERILEFLRSQVGKPFDSTFSIERDDSFYCSELVVKAFEQAGVGLAVGVPRTRVMLVAEPVFHPDHLRLSPLLRRVESRRGGVY